METYHKIQTLFKRHQDGKKKGKMIPGEWTTPELDYLSGNQWEFTEKIDGTNIRIELCLVDGVESTLFVNYGGRTDNAVIPSPLLEYLEETFPTFPTYRRSLSMPGHHKRHAEVKAWMEESKLEKVVLFGEGYGPKIQSGGKYTGGENVHSFMLFDVKIGDFWLSRENVDDIASKLGIESVPTIGHGTLQDAIDIVSSGITFNKQGAVVRWGRGGLQSQFGSFEAEGIVARPVVPMFDRKGQRIITKIKAVDFK